MRGPQTLRRTGALGFHAIERSQSLLHGRVATLRSSLLAQSNERSANQRLQLRLALDRQLIAKPTDSVHQRAAVAAAIQFCKVRQTNCRRAARLRVIQANAQANALHQDFVHGLQLAAPQHVLEVRANVSRRNAPRLFRRQHFLLVFVGYLFPEFLVQQFGVGLHLQPRVRHNFFLRAQNLA